jgi:hypothetical protein
MNNKILIGSIIAVSLLIGVSFTSVVGYKSVESDVKISPLFNIRSSRAVDKENDGLTTDYVGKGEESVLSIPGREGKTVLIQKFIENIRMMDEQKFDNFIDIIKKEIVKNDKLRDNDIPKLISVVNSFRDGNFQIIYVNQIPFELTVNPLFCFILYKSLELFLLIAITIYIILYGFPTFDNCLPSIDMPCHL